MAIWHYNNYIQWIKNSCKINNNVTILKLNMYDGYLSNLSENIDKLINLQ